MERGVPPDGTQYFSWRNSDVFCSLRWPLRRIIITRQTHSGIGAGASLKEGEMLLARVSRLAIALAVMTVGSSLPAVAQSYPSNTIRIVTSGAAGTPPDIILRIVANELGRSEGWQIVVENKVGAIGK